MSEADKTIQQIIDGFRILGITALCIYAAYLIIDTIAGELPAWVASALIGLYVLYVNVTKSKVKAFFSK